MPINFKSTFSAKKKIENFNKETKQKMGVAMEVTKTQVLARTADGKGSEGSLKKYSDKKYFDSKGKRINFFSKNGKIRPLESYREYKIRTLGTDKVTLRETGNMLNAMQTTVEQVANGILGKIFFSEQERKKAFFNNLLRPNFFKLSREQLKNIVRRLQK